MTGPSYEQEQYRDGTRLAARQAIHDRFSTNPKAWHRWLFEQLDLAPDARILEVGCGPARLWAANLERVSPGWDVLLSDASAAMLDEARRALARSARGFRFEVFSAEDLPCDDASFDAVIANHMLYHVADDLRDRAIGELHRVLRPGGCLYAATNGQRALAEAYTLIGAWLPNLRGPDHAERFGLETGEAQLARHFSGAGSVACERYEDALEVTEVEPLVDYLLSMATDAELPRVDRAGLHAEIAGEIARSGCFRITKDSGVFVATR